MMRSCCSNVMRTVMSSNLIWCTIAFVLLAIRWCPAEVSLREKITPPLTLRSSCSVPIFRILVDQCGFFNDQLLYIYLIRKGNDIITHGSTVRMASERDSVDIVTCSIQASVAFSVLLILLNYDDWCILFYFFTLIIRKPQMPCKYIYSCHLVTL